MATEFEDARASVREALETLATRESRDSAGRFTRSNVAALTTGARSDALWSALTPARDTLIARTLSDRGTDERSATGTLSRLIGAYAGISLFREAMELRLLESGGPISNKGRSRPLYAAYLNALDRETRLAQLIGLERAAKPAQSLADVLAQHEEPAGE